MEEVGASSAAASERQKAGFAHTEAMQTGRQEHAGLLAGKREEHDLSMQEMRGEQATSLQELRGEQDLAKFEREKSHQQTFVDKETGAKLSYKQVMERYKAESDEFDRPPFNDYVREKFTIAGQAEKAAQAPGGQTSQAYREYLQKKFPDRTPEQIDARVKERFPEGGEPAPAIEPPETAEEPGILSGRTREEKGPDYEPAEEVAGRATPFDFFARASKPKPEASEPQLRAKVQALKTEPQWNDVQWLTDFLQKNAANMGHEESIAIANRIAELRGGNAQ